MILLDTPALIRILIIEDDPELNRNVREALTAENMIVESVYDGLLAERMLKISNFDCILLDVNLPGKNGFELARDDRCSHLFIADSFSFIYELRKC